MHPAPARREQACGDFGAAQELIAQIARVIGKVIVVRISSARLHRPAVVPACPQHELIERLHRGTGK
jgi:hypothetical protein